MEQHSKVVGNRNGPPLHWGRIFLNIVFGTLLWISALPCILIVFLPLLFLRLAHHGLATLLHPELEPIWGVEDAILALAPTSAHLNMNTAQVWKLNGVLDLDQFRKHFFQCFLSRAEKRKKYRNLRARIVSWGCYTWKMVDDSVDLVKAIKAGPRLEEIGENELEPWIAEWMARNDYNSVAWEAIVLQGASDSYLLVKMDHALTDGYTWAYLTSVLAGVVENMPYLVKGHEDMGFWRRVGIFLGFPAESVFQIWGYLRGGRMQYGGRQDAGGGQKEWMFSLGRLDLEKVKSVRREEGVHFNTVLGTIVVGAMRRVCVEMGVTKLAERVWLPSPVGWPNHPIMMKDGEMRNHMSIGNQCFPFSENDPLKRLHCGERSVLEAESVGQSIGFRWVVARFAWVMPSSLLRLVLRKIVPLVSGGLDQVLTPLLMGSTPHKLLDLDVVGLHLPVHVPSLLVPTKVYVVPVSIGGVLEVCVSATKEAFSDQSDLDRFTKVLLIQELDHLFNSATCKQGKSESEELTELKVVDR